MIRPPQATYSWIDPGRKEKAAVGIIGGNAGAFAVISTSKEPIHKQLLMLGDSQARAKISNHFV
jgi:hypothetical protein